LVQRQGTLKNDDYIFKFIVDKSKSDEYFLEMSDSRGKPFRLLAVNDI